MQRRRMCVGLAACVDVAACQLQSRVSDTDDDDDVWLCVWRFFRTPKQKGNGRQQQDDETFGLVEWFPHTGHHC